MLLLPERKFSRNAFLQVDIAPSRRTFKQPEHWFQDFVSVKFWRLHSSFQKAPWTTCCAQLPLFTDLLKFSDTSHQAISKRFNLPEVHPLLPVETAPCSVMKSIHPCFGQNVSIRPLHEIWVKVVSFSNAFSTIPIQHSNIHLTHLRLRIEALIKRNSTKRSCINVIYQLLL